MIIHPFLSFFLNLLSCLLVAFFPPKPPLVMRSRDLGRRWCIGWIDGRVLVVSRIRNCGVGEVGKVDWD